jgi:sucrose-phosphate synthase
MQDTRLYLQLFSIHGLIRGENPELGRDADTGGQVKYVLELARSLALLDEVAQVDLVTRLIDDKSVSPDYAVPVEQLSDKARIIRIQCGGRKYLRKELLWPHLEEFIDKTIRFLKQQRQVPDLFHGHYADAGQVALGLAVAFDRPCIFTGHSLGRSKLERLLAGGMTTEQIEKRYRISTRIDAEELLLRKASLIVCSTKQEVEQQYGLYRVASQPAYAVIPPGIDLEVFYPYYEYCFNPRLLDERVKQVRLTLQAELKRFWAQPDKPFILALCRPDQRKNIAGLVKAYGMNPELRALANLAIFAGIRHDISTMEDNEREVLTEMLLLLDTYDLYGKMAIPKRHDFATEVPELYRLCADHGGVFINPALVEPFGITLIEAASCGLPIVATNDGGPVDIVAYCDNGMLVDATKPGQIASALKELLVNRHRWEKYSQNGINGVRESYAWPAHCIHYLDRLRPLLGNTSTRTRPRPEKPAGKSEAPAFGIRLINSQRLLIADIDNTLVGDPESLSQLLNLLARHREKLVWGVATGRSLELTLEAITKFAITMPDIIISSVGTAIYYGSDLYFDKGWQHHICRQWKPDHIREVLGELPFLTLQEQTRQRSHKISYFLDDDPDLLARVQQTLKTARLHCNVIYSHGHYLDILPLRASKGKAIKYLMYKYQFQPENVMVAGDSGNDLDMLRGPACGLVVANHSQELERLRGKPRIRFSPASNAAGIIDGLHHYGLLDE